MHRKIPCAILRGGTSKGLFLLEKDLPPVGAERDAILLRLMGSPDAKQIDGLGGGRSVTSKAAILAPSARPDADVDYTFAQISVDKPIVSYVGNCGNISSGVAPFAIESGLITALEGETTVRIFNTNTKKLIVAKVSTPRGKVCYDGDYTIAGVAGSASPIKIFITKPEGTVFGRLLPTGNPKDILEIPGFGSLEVSIVDAANPLVFVRAEDIGMSGRELPVDIDNQPHLLELLEDIRGMAAYELGMVTNFKQARNITPGVPKMTIVTQPIDYTSVTGNVISAADFDLTGRMMSMQKTHPTYALTGAMCTAAAAVIPRTIVCQSVRQGVDYTAIRIGHPEGIFEVGVLYNIDKQGSVEILEVYSYRTARMLMWGIAYY